RPRLPLVPYPGLVIVRLELTVVVRELLLRAAGHTISDDNGDKEDDKSEDLCSRQFSLVYYA
ncbi:hypothetical protein FRC09_004977, partial [Ceratobasidium sp. 395]